MSSQTLQMTQEIRNYLLRWGVRESAQLRGLREETLALGDEARMQISPEQGQFMAFLTETLAAKRLLEVGTFTGYSAMVCAAALPADGKLVTCDLSDEWTGIARRHWKKAGVDAKIELRLGPAARTLKELLDGGARGTFDLMFIDADKTGYDAYYELGLQLVRAGGVILIDNTLWSGAVADPSEKDDDTVALRRLNEKIAGDARVAMSLLPVGDGLTLVRVR